jgi:hemerythrin-like metal-binding protein
VEVHVSLLSWNHACSVEVRAMDDQHGILMDTINDLRLAFMHGCGREQAGELLLGLIEFTRMHFCYEETLMQQAEYPGLICHRAEHQRMLAEMLHAEHRVQNDDELQTGPMLLALRNGFLAHIEGLDRAYGPWLHDRGIS